jgi:aldoxime dehydratase
MTASAIPQHLKVARTVPPTRNPPVGNSEFASFSHWLPKDMKALSIAYLGVQSATADWSELTDAIRDLDRGLDRAGGPDHRDRARYEDEAGYKTIMIAAYWLQPNVFEKWRSGDGMQWVDPLTAPDGLGRFLEALCPSLDRLETINSSAEGREGFGAIAESVSPPIAEHGYWGSMRDRLPISQVNAVTRGADGPVLESRGRVEVIRLDANACIIRSGQDYSDTKGEERNYYLQNVEPTLRTGMTFLRDDGLPIGCYVNRYVQIVDADFALTEKSYAVSWWVDMAALEHWAKSHPTHVAIFNSFMRHMTRFDQDAQLRLYHEVMVPDANQQEFRYLDCHPNTGVLRAVSKADRRGVPSR